MKHALNIVRKELDKIFKNPRLIFSTFILPGLMIFLIYSTMGTLATDEVDRATSEKSVIYLINSVENFENVIEGYNLAYPEDSEGFLNAEFINYTEDEITKEKLESDLKNGLCDAYVFFEKDFETKLATRLENQTSPLPIVDCYSLSTSTKSSVATQKIAVLLQIFEEITVQSVYGDTTIFESSSIDLATKEEQSNFVLGMILPMLLIIFVFAGGLGVGADAIAGEKERGTIATLMMAPINKNEIVLGKVASAIIITLLSALGSFIGVAASLPSAGEILGGADLTLFNFTTLSGLFLLIMTTALIAVTLFLLASTLGKSVKEATSYAMPFYIIAMVVSVSTMYMEQMPTEITKYMIPIYNLSLGIKGLLIGDISTIYLLVIIGSNFVYFLIGVFLMVKMFKSERIMFAK